jgi:hypothetical protein
VANPAFADEFVKQLDELKETQHKSNITNIPKHRSTI